jgi:hypothetical protein
MKNKYKITIVLCIIIFAFIIVLLVCTNIFGIKKSYDEYTSKNSVGTYVEQDTSKSSTVFRYVGTDNCLCDILALEGTDTYQLFYTNDSNAETWEYYVLVNNYVYYVIESSDRVYYQKETELSYDEVLNNIKEFEQSK